MLNYLIILLIINSLIFLIHEKISGYYNIYDLPDNSRKFHKKTTSLVGGPLIIFNLVFYIFYLYFNRNISELDSDLSNKTLFIFLFLVSTFFLIGYFDDKSDISANKKFMMTILLVYFSILIDKNILISELSFTFTSKIIYLENFSIIFSVICVMLFINAFNMFDGINGQAGGYFFILLLALYFKGFNIILLITFLIPTLFFLYLNLQGKMFLGNTGSLVLSVMISLFFILHYNSEKILSDEIILFLIFPGLDMLRLFLERIKNNKSPFLADNQHLHHFIIENSSLGLTLFLTVIVQGLIFMIYIFNEISVLYFIIFLVFYYLTLYLYFRKKTYAKKNNIR